MSDQNGLWNGVYKTKSYAQSVLHAQDFAKQVGENITPDSKLLELGCGVGSDAKYFAGLGAEVIATDFSQVVIDQDKAQNGLPNVTFQRVDITQPLPFSDEAFDAVYAHLSLHYHNEETTAATFKEIARVLKPGGILYFSCKSVHDPKYGEGVEIEPGVFERDGHVRHFFSLEYTKQLVTNDFKIVQLEEVRGTYSGSECAFIHCWARKG